MSTQFYEGPTDLKLGARVHILWFAYPIEEDGEVVAAMDETERYQVRTKCGCVSTVHRDEIIEVLRVA